MTVCHRSESHGRGLSLQPIGCTLALSVTYRTAAAAVAACGTIYVLCLYVLPLLLYVFIKLLLRKSSKWAK